MAGIQFVGAWCQGLIQSKLLADIATEAINGFDAQAVGHIEQIPPILLLWQVLEWLTHVRA